MSLTAPQRLDHPTLPEGQLLYAVGDIHGRADLLRSLLAAIAADAAAKRTRSAQDARLSRRLCGSGAREPGGGRHSAERAAARVHVTLPQGQSRGDPARLSPRCHAARAVAGQWRRCHHGLLWRRCERSRPFGRRRRDMAQRLRRRASAQASCVLQESSSSACRSEIICSCMRDCAQACRLPRKARPTSSGSARPSSITPGRSTRSWCMVTRRATSRSCGRTASASTREPCSPAG